MAAERRHVDMPARIYLQTFVRHQNIRFKEGSKKLRCRGDGFKSIVEPKNGLCLGTCKSDLATQVHRNDHRGSANCPDDSLSNMLNGCSSRWQATACCRNQSKSAGTSHMPRWAVSAGNTEYKHMVVSAGRTQMRNQIDGMDR